MTDGRADPEALLLRAKREGRAQSGRGMLRIYLGAFAGIGKTYAMLNEAQRRRKYGEDVVVGFVETHRRPQTVAVLDGLEVIPRKKIDYRGVVVEEMDVEAILRRRPAVCLIDELAHTNAPGSEREKRYEDVEVILDAGIGVVSTLNVQHLESLNDTVESITGIKVRETIPDRIVDDADEVILIDLSPEAARARMEHGNIYPPEQARVALQSFFRPQNLAALREIALRRTAQEVDEQLDTYMREAASASKDVDEHVLVWIDATPFARTLIRRGWRLAQGMHADLVVAYNDVELSDKATRELNRSLELGEDLNAEIVALTSARPAEALRELIVARRIDHLVVAHKPQGALSRMRGASLIDELMRVPDLSLHVVSTAASRTP
jgi:two-component system sensor histidine kinase KdpD